MGLIRIDVYLYLLPFLSISGNNVFREELFAVGDVYDISQEPLR